MTYPEHDPALKDRVVRLMGFLRKLAIKRSRPIRNVKDHRRVIWLATVLDHVPVDEEAQPGETVFTVPKVQVSAEPEAPAHLRYWLDWTDEGPELRQQGPDPRTGDTVAADQIPEVREAFDEWLPQWRRWAEAQTRRRALRNLHDQIADMKLQADQQPESLELVLASGLLSAPAHDEIATRIHLVSHPVSIDIDRDTGEVRCALSDDELPRLEDDELIGDFDFYDRSAAPSLRGMLADTAKSPLDPEVIGFLKHWAERALDTECAVSDGWEPTSGKPFRLDFAPALILRSRGSYALRRYYEQISGALDSPSEPVPLGLAQLVKPIEATDKLAWLERTNATAAASLADDPLFPLPANDQQREVIRRLGEDSGVVVEGPPGTGKTHTIANLMSALLARGQRILVTSEKSQALHVLRDKLPEPMRDLCVSMTTQDRKTKAAAGKSVSALSDRYANFNPEVSDQWIRELTARRDTARRRRAELLEQIRSLRESESYQHPEIAPGYAGTLSEIIRAVNQTADVGWIKGNAAGECPLSTEEFAELVRLLRAENDQRRSRRNQRMPSPDELPGEQEVMRLATAVAEGARVTGSQHGEVIRALGDLSDQQLRQLSQTCRAVEESIAALRALPVNADWLTDMTSALFRQQKEHLWHRARASLELVDEALHCDQQAGHAEIVATDVPPAMHTAFRDFAEYLNGGGKIRNRFKKPQQQAVDPYLPTVRVKGMPVTTAEAAFGVAQHLRAIEIAETIRAAFDPLGYVVDTNLPRSAVVDQLVQLRKVCYGIDAVSRIHGNLTVQISALPPGTRPRVDTLDGLIEFAARTMDAERAYSAKMARAQLTAAAEQLTAQSPPQHRAPELDALATALTSYDAHAYKDGLRALEVARLQQEDQRRCDALLTRVAQACPTLAEELADSAALPHWTERVRSWPDAWARACAASWVTQQTSLGADDDLDAALDATTKDLEKITADLAAERAWNACLRRMTAEEVGALNSYANLTSSAGKGTGRYQERYRAAAREAMSVAQSAVPAWVMPIKQVLDTVPTRQNAFDVIIVDEASQADLTSTFLLWLAPRIIVVGDDKQCTPSEVSSGALEPIFESLDSELHDVPAYLRTEFTPRSSMFSILRSRFGQLIRLREHFRCMPEIIQWCSEEFYQDQPLVPVRQFGADRLPPLRVQHVSGGYVLGRNQSLHNPVEAEAIADSIVSCLEDPDYEGKTFGVVVLQGQRQVDEIKNALHNRFVAPEVWQDRQLRIGTASDFQGDERHVVWLSMVVTPDHNFRALTQATFQRSFNVAVSRAQDQLLLFHSVTKDQLRPGDLRLSLLQYMAASRQPLDPVLNDVQRDVRHPRFDSLFEQRVFLDLVERGYHVTPQVESNGRRIDLVVAGDGAKLAVECDGDQWHETAEQLAADLYREQELKRCGWKFWRVRGSSYYWDKEQALASLWPTLDRLGIRPILDGAPALPLPVPELSEPEQQHNETSVNPDTSASTEPPPGDEVESVAETSDRTWADTFSWLRTYRPGENPDLDEASEVSGWWLATAPNTAQSSAATACRYAAAAALVDDWPADKPLAAAFPAVPVETRIDDLELSRKTLNVLRLHGLDTSASVGRLTLADLRGRHRVSRTTLLEVITSLVGETLQPQELLGDVTDFENALPAPPVPDDGSNDVLGLVDRWFDQLCDRDLVILSKRLFAEDPAALESLVTEHGITRERIRQLEASARRKLNDQLAASHSLMTLLEEVRSEIRPVAAMQRLLSRHPILTERVSAIGKPLWYVLDKLDDYFEVVDGWALSPNVRTARERTHTLLSELGNEHGVVALAALSPLLTEFAMAEDELRAWLTWCDYEIINGHVLPTTRSTTDRAVAMLSIAGEPLTTSSLADQLDVGNVSMLSDQLANDARFVRVDHEMWALGTWDIEEYTIVRDQIGRIVDSRAGSVPLTELVGELTARFRGLTPAVIRAHAAAPPFETRSGVVRRGTAGLARRKQPAQTRHLFRHDGCWVYRMVVTSEHLRGSEIQVPVGLATAIGLEPDEAVEFHSQQGLQSVRWRTQQPQLASIRRFLEHEEVDVGATVFLLFFDSRLFRLVKAPRMPSESEPLRRALWLIGANNTDPDNAEPALMKAIGLRESADRTEILRAFRDRQDDDIADALERAWP